MAGRGQRDAFIDGLGGDADALLAAHLDRATTRLAAAVAKARPQYARPPVYETIVQMRAPTLERVNARPVSADRTTKLGAAALRSTAYAGWKRSMFTADWFDSNPERDIANLGRG